MKRLIATIVAAGWLVSFAPANGQGTWSPTGSLDQGRIYFAGTLLRDGRVLVAGDSSLSDFSCELYDPAAGTWSLTGKLNYWSKYNTLTLLQDGRALNVGNHRGVPVAEVYDPNSGTWTVTGDMTQSRELHTATLLPNGKVLVAGGTSFPTFQNLASAELYDPSTSSWSATGSMGTARVRHCATLLQNGKVLVASGGGTPEFVTQIRTAEIYDPVTETWTPTGDLIHAHENFTMTLLPDGRVLVAGGDNPEVADTWAGAEIYDPNTGTWTATGSMNTERQYFTATLLPNGQVLAASGYTLHLPDDIVTAELYDPATGAWSFTGNLNFGHHGHVALLLQDGNVLVVGDSYYSKPAEIYHPVMSPQASAGDDQTVFEGMVTALDGSGSSSPSGDTIYTWTQIAGVPVVLDESDPARPTFTAPVVPMGGATLTFQLVVSDAGGTSAPDVVNVTVTNISHAPVALADDLCGMDGVVEGGSATLDGSNSFDEDDEFLTYVWTQTGGLPVTLSDPFGAMTTFVVPPVGSAGATLTFVLAVSDGEDVGTVLVQVCIENVNHDPTANAGPDQTRVEAAAVSLDGSASTDPDGDPLSFAWLQLGGPTVTLSGASSPAPSFVAPNVASTQSLVFQLTVDDGYGGHDDDTVTVTVQDGNAPPACDRARASVGELWPPNHKLVPITIEGVTDPEHDHVTITILSVRQDEPVNGLGDGDTAPDAVIQGGTVLLRAERSGTGNGRVYHVSFLAADGFGGTCSGEVTVQVPHSKGKNSSAVDGGAIYDSTGS